MLYWGLTAEGWKWNKLFDCSEPKKNKKILYEIHIYLRNDSQTSNPKWKTQNFDRKILKDTWDCHIWT